MAHQETVVPPYLVGIKHEKWVLIGVLQGI